MGERTVGEVMVLVAGAALGNKLAKDITAEEWDEFVARCRREAERPEPDIEPPSATLDTGHVVAGEGGDGPFSESESGGSGEAGDGGVVGVDLGEAGGDESGGAEAQTITPEDVGDLTEALDLG